MRRKIATMPKGGATWADEGFSEVEVKEFKREVAQIAERAQRRLLMAETGPMPFPMSLWPRVSMGRKLFSALRRFFSFKNESD